MVVFLGNTVVDDKDIRIIKNLYWNQSDTININVEEQTNLVNILRAVPQGCNLSKLIFNLYSKNLQENP